ncbi:hypothetical protein A2U01_0082992, partial [Trifolium medium]|nr:hypothetical protein [Trifolium medium]
PAWPITTRKMADSGGQLAA